MEKNTVTLSVASEVTLSSDKGMHQNKKNQCFSHSLVGRRHACLLTFLVL